MSNQVAAQAPAPATDSSVEQKQAPIEELEIKEPEGEASEAQSVESSEPSVKKEEEKAEKAKTLKKLKYKFKDKEQEEELPFEIPDDPKAVTYMKEQLQLAKLAQMSAKERADLERELNEFVDAIRSNPREVLSDPALGLDLKKLAAEIIEEEIQNSKKSPEQIEKERVEKELKDLKKQYEREKEEFRQKEYERLQSQAFDTYKSQVSQALAKSSLPQSRYVETKVYDHMYEALKRGYEVKIEDILPLVEEEIQTEIRQMFDVAPEDVVQKIISKEKLNNIRKKNIEKAKSAPPPLSKAVKDTGVDGKQERKASLKKESYKDFFKF